MVENNRNCDQRNGDRGRLARKPWFERYLALVLFIALNIVGFTGTLIVTWADTKEALRTANENKKELKSREKYTYAIPHIDSKIDTHVEEFKDFRTEQRSFNKSVGDKLDYIIKKL